MKKQNGREKVTPFWKEISQTIAFE